MAAIVDARPYLELKEWSAAYVDADPAQIGLAGSPTKVKGIVNVVFQAKESKRLDGRDQAALEDLIKELIKLQLLKVPNVLILVASMKDIHNNEVMNS